MSLDHEIDRMTAATAEVRRFADALTVVNPGSYEKALHTVRVLQIGKEQLLEVQDQFIDSVHKMLLTGKAKIEVLRSRMDEIENDVLNLTRGYEAAQGLDVHGPSQKDFSHHGGVEMETLGDNPRESMER